MSEPSLQRAKPSPDPKHSAPTRDSHGRAWQNRILEGAGFATLYVLPITSAFFKPWHVNAYHHAHPVGSIPRAIFFLTLLVWALAACVIQLADRLPARARDISWIALTVFLVWILGRVLAGILDAHPVAVMLTLRATRICLPLAAAALLATMGFRPKALRQVIAAVRAFSKIAAFGMLILMPKLAWQGFRSGPPEQRSFINPVLRPASSTSPRILWILMDELSYKLVFEQRPPGMAFPHFEEFARQSVNFSDVQPTGYYTELVIPGLILGQPVADVEHIYGKPFQIRSQPRGSWHPYEAGRTIFGDAHRLGWTTGIAGWFNPYCRILPGVLDRCFWQFSDVYPGLPVKLYYNWPTVKNLVALLPPHERMDPFAVRRIDHETHLQDYREVLAQAEDLVRDRRIRFVFLHLPVPHTPGIYDRSSRRLVPAGNYIDNLALADETMGRLLEVVQSTPAASETTIILSSDHSWRVADWKKLSDWTPEEQRIAGNRFDSRPVLVVHLPGSERGEIDASPTGALAVHALIEAMLRGQVHTNADVTAVATSQPAPAEPASTQK